MKEFKLRLDQDWFQKEDILEGQGVQVKVLEKPYRRDKWWWKILRFLTFGFFFQPEYCYKVEIVK